MRGASDISHSKHQEISLDGVRYAKVFHHGQWWRIGSVNPLWREELTALGSTPDSETLESLGQRGIWLSRDTAPAPLALMCGGLGAQWPGMGKALYESFPVARQALDLAARVADENLTHIMNDPGGEKFNQARWQIPWLFALEYAQWAQLRSLGLQPSLLCGHSIGELIALCFAGVYDFISAWYLFSARAAIISDFGMKPGKEGGMLAVSADEPTLKKILDQWPSLFIANRNTPRQFVLSGPRATLMEARKILRKEHVPAFMLNINLAFHNPAMRALRDLSVFRLNMLDIRAPRIPILSCVTSAPYPGTEREICEYIANLDEMTVNWPATMAAMKRDFHIGVFVELGPQEVLCGLGHELEPEAICIAADRKDNEESAMRTLCARLFALGHLSWEAIATQKNERPRQEEGPEIIGECPNKNNGAPHFSAPENWKGDEKDIVALLAEMTDRKRSEIHRDMDLRHDLGLRSSRFPLLAQEVELKIGKSADLENMFPLITVGDLLRFFLGEENETISGPESHAALPAGLPPLLPHILDIHSQHLKPLKIDPARPMRTLARGDIVALCLDDDFLLPGLFLSLAPLGLAFAIPSGQMELCEPLRLAGAQILPLACENQGRNFVEALKGLYGRQGKIAGIIFAPGPLPKNGEAKKAARENMEFLRLLTDYSGDAAIYVVQRWPGETSWDSGVESHKTIMDYSAALRGILADRGGQDRVINWLCQADEDKRTFPPEAGDLLALEILYSPPGISLWQRGGSDSVYDAASSIFDYVFPDPVLPAGAGFFHRVWQVGNYSLPMLNCHGGEKALFSPIEGAHAHAPWLPVILPLGALLDCAGQNLPWLDIVAVANLNIGPAAAVPSGITRECRIRSHSHFWLAQDKKLSRLCRTWVELRDISANGRRVDAHAPLLEGECFFGANSHPPLWSMDAFWPQAGAVIEADLPQFYKMLSLGEIWHVLKKFSYIPAPDASNERACQYEAIPADGKSFIAALPNWRYKYFLFLIECVVQGCLLALATGRSGTLPDMPDMADMAEEMRKWRLSSAGWIHFNKMPEQSSPAPVIQLRKSWEDDCLIHFEAQTMNSGGEYIMGIRQLEFDRVGK